MLFIIAIVVVVIALLVDGSDADKNTKQSAGRAGGSALRYIIQQLFR